MVDIGNLAASALVSGIVAVGVTEFRFRRERVFARQYDLDDWYREVRALARRIQRIDSFQGPTHNLEEMGEAVRDAMSELEELVHETPLDADDDVRTAVEDTIEKCSSAHIFIRDSNLSSDEQSDWLGGRTPKQEAERRLDEMNTSASNLQQEIEKRL